MGTSTASDKGAKWRAFERRLYDSLLSCIYSSGALSSSTALRFRAPGISQSVATFMGPYKVKERERERERERTQSQGHDSGWKRENSGVRCPWILGGLHRLHQGFTEKSGDPKLLVDGALPSPINPSPYQKGQPQSMP